VYSEVSGHVLPAFYVQASAQVHAHTCFGIGAIKALTLSFISLEKREKELRREKALGAP
jgi:hypothetical protein